MHYPAYKEELIRSLSAHFTPYQSYTKTDVDRIIRDAVDEASHNPSLATDHLRIGLVELGCLKRSTDGSSYKLNTSELLHAKTLRAILGNDYPIEKITSIGHLRKVIRRNRRAERQHG